MFFQNKKQTGLWLLFAVIITLLSFEFRQDMRRKAHGHAGITPASWHKKQTQVLTQIVSLGHYKKVAIDDAFSKRVYENYMKKIDGRKLYFIQQDLDYFSQYQYDFDDYLRTGTLEVPFQIFSFYRERVLNRIEKALTLLEGPMDFSLSEYYTLEEEDFAKDMQALDERWRKLIKHEAINLKLTGKSWEEAQEDLSKRYRNYQKNAMQYEAKDACDLFLNSYTELIDPHTNYFTPFDSEGFSINMTLSLEGIGAVLSREMEYTVIREVLVGGPAYKSEALAKDDKIVGVAQDDEDFQEVIGWRLDEVISLIRGPKNTKVRLKILPAGQVDPSMTREVSLIREKIKLENSKASKSVHKHVFEGKTYTLGVIKLPSFYLDWNAARKKESDYASASRDVKALIQNMETDDIDGLVIDLRYNSGGSLSEAVALTGLFIEKGPVVQVKNTRNRVQVHTDKDASIAYEGPLVVLVNRFSASASEIFAAAIQDYRRGVVVGEYTYGKGTVQNLIALSQYITDEEKSKIGQLKLTIAKYYRINGSSTQRVGVLPDVSFFSQYDSTQYRENARESALVWDEIERLPYDTLHHYSGETIDVLQAQYEEDVATDSLWLAYVEDAVKNREKMQRKEISLSYEARKKETKVGKSLEENEEKKAEKKEPFLQESLRMLSVLIETEKHQKK